MSPNTPSRITPPPLLTGCALIFWGFLTGQLVIGILLALVLEARHFVSARWEISDDLFRRIWNLCFILFLAIFIISLIRFGPAQGMYLCVQWLPAAMLPIAVAQVYSTRSVIPTSTFSSIAKYLQKTDRAAGGRERPPRLVNIEYVYIGTAVVAAGAANRPGLVFYIGIVLLLAVALWRHAPRRSIHPAGWFVALLLVSGLGFVGHVYLHKLQLLLESTGFLAMLPQGEMMANRGFTRIGSVGKLKLSSAVRWRMRRETGAIPEYLRTDTYDTYRRGLWFIKRGRSFRPLLPRQSAVPISSWDYGRLRTDSASRVTLTGKRSGSMTFLSLPGTPLGLQDLPASMVATNAMASARATDADRLLKFSVTFTDDLSGDMPPGEEDLAIPEELVPGLTRVVAQLGLQDLPPRSRLEHLHRFFSDQFTYTTYLNIKEKHARDLGGAVIAFLEKDRRGHCEYFATASVLLLRQAGIPARYATGYGISEYHKGRQEYLVRGLHAHAWAQAWVDGRWEVVENTPASWLSEESAGLSWAQPLKDWFAHIPHAFVSLKDSPFGKGTVSAFKWLGFPALAIWLWLRLFKGQRLKRRRRKKEPAVVAEPPPGLDSACYELERRLADLVGQRPASEPLRSWWRRVGDRIPVKVGARIDEAIHLHYRLRFAPGSLDTDSQSQLQALVASVIEELPGQHRPPA